jgi:AbrB family looped-hinge helix DNA binding protein
MRARTRITGKGQVVIPKAVRERLRWNPGTELGVEATEDGAVVLRPAVRGRTRVDELLDELSGWLRPYGGDPIAELEGDHRAEIQADERRR